MSDEINTNEVAGNMQAEAAEQVEPAQPVLDPVQETQTPEPVQTAQMGGNEPLDSATSRSLEAPPPTAPVVPQPSRNFISELLAKGRIAIQGRKRKKIDRIMDLFEKRSSITNDEVEKLLHVSDATATRYLNILEQEGRIKQSGKTGKSVFYTKI